MSLKTFFSGGAITRQVDTRADPQRLQAAWQSEAARFIAIRDSRCLVDKDGAAVLLDRKALGADWYPADGIYLGELGQRHMFAVELPGDGQSGGPDDEAFANFRGLLSGMSADDAALLAYAKGMLEWHKCHRFCGLCGAPNQSVEGGFVLTCSAAECGARNFPRLDPAIIVLTLDNERCLLGRQNSWPERHFSTIAGFMEPGESLEDAVRREVKEETDIDVGECWYQGSQPWPFPTAVMIGFHARAQSTKIHLNDGELVEAHWYTREQIAAGHVVLPPATSIAFCLIEHWFNDWEGPSLASFELSGHFSRRAGDRS